MSILRRPFGALGVAALSALAFATPALSQSDLIVSFDAGAGSVTRSRAVDISDLQLSTASGRASAKKRIVMAAKQVCDHQSMSIIRKSKDYDRCFDEARTAALRQIGPVQTALLD